VQLDLFLDSREVLIANEAVEALVARDATRAAAKVDELAEEGPNHPALPALQLMTRALASWERPAADSAAIARRVARLQDEVAPAAAAVLGASARLFVHPFLLELAETARGLPYDAAHPQAHRAHLCLLGGDYDDAEEAVRAIADWRDNRDALHWLSVARYRREGLDAAREPVFQLAWRAPTKVPALLAELDDALLLREWNAFEAACAWPSIGGGRAAALVPRMVSLGASGCSRTVSGHGTSRNSSCKRGTPAAEVT
jgi:hypothetical protein